MSNVTTASESSSSSSIGSTANPYPVEPTGFLIGSYFATFLYGLHIAQVHRYFTTYKRTDSWRTRAVVVWVATLSTAQVGIIVACGYKYFVRGIEDDAIWETFWWPLSVQDGLIPLMAFTAQLYFGRRAWILSGRKRWLALAAVILPCITMAAGVSLAVTARLWASAAAHSSISALQDSKMSTPAQAMAITWMALSAFTDGSLTLILITRFRRAGKTTSSPSAQSLVHRLVALTLETVLLTHIVGATMCILFLASPPSHRTDTDAFWFFLEIITELYALSILFTINSRDSSRRLMRSDLTTLSALTRTRSASKTDAECHTNAHAASALDDTRPPAAADDDNDDGGIGKLDFNNNDIELELDDRRLRQSALDRAVEGYQGDTPFGVFMARAKHGSGVDSDIGTVSRLGYISRLDADDVETATGTGLSKRTLSDYMAVPGPSTGPSTAPSLHTD